MVGGVAPFQGELPTNTVFIRWSLVCFVGDIGGVETRGGGTNWGRSIKLVGSEDIGDSGRV